MTLDHISHSHAIIIVGTFSPDHTRAEGLKTSIPQGNSASSPLGKLNWCHSVWQATSTEAWIYRNNSTREAIVSFRGTSDPKDMMTDAAMSLAAFSPGQRPDSRSPEDVANGLSDEELENGPLGGIFKGIKVT